MADKKTEGAVNLPGKGIWENNFDPRIQGIPSYLPGEGGSSFGLQRGYMVTAFPKSNTSKENRFYMLNFLYNPSTVSVNHSTDAANQVMPPYTRSDLDTGVPLVAAGGTLFLRVALRPHLRDVGPDEIQHDRGHVRRDGRHPRFV